jgi:hypothetical protein
MSHLNGLTPLLFFGSDPHSTLTPQHFLYFFPLPHGHGSLRPIFSDRAGSEGFNAFSKSEMSSGLSGSKPTINFHPWAAHWSATYLALCSERTRTTIGLLSVPILAIVSILSIHFVTQCCGSAARPEASLLAEGIGCCIRMVVRRAAPSSLRMIIRSIVEAARGRDNLRVTRAAVRQRDT